MNNYSYSILYKPEHLLMNLKLLNQQEKWEKILTDFIKNYQLKETLPPLIIYSHNQEKFLKERIKIPNLSIIGEDEYKTISPVCIYYIKDDTDIEQELKTHIEYTNTQIKFLDDTCNIDKPEWANKDIIDYGNYAADICDNKYIFASKEDFNLLNNMLSLKKPIFILGERGSGKTTIIQNFIKKSLKLSDDNFVSVACGTLEPSLAKSELFGYVPGAFSDAAKTGAEGLIQKANGGCLYLDEIQDLSKEIQRILIKGIEEHKFYKVGANETFESNFLLICSSNKTLNELKQLLYDDFYDRISTFQYKIKSIEEQKAIDEDFIKKCLPNVWRNYKEKCSNKNQFLDYEQLDSFNTNNQTIKEKITNALKRNTLRGNYRDIEKLLANIELYALNAKVFFESPSKEQINDKIDLAITKWEEELKERDSFTPDLTAAFIEKQSWEGINKMFKNWIAEQAIKTYGSATAAAKALNGDKNSILKAKRTLQ